MNNSFIKQLSLIMLANMCGTLIEGSEAIYDKIEISDAEIEELFDVLPPVPKKEAEMDKKKMQEKRETEKTKEVHPVEVDPDLHSFFFKMIKNGDVDGVKAALAQGKNPNCLSMECSPSLMVAIIMNIKSTEDSQQGRRLLDILGAFIEHGGNVNYQQGPKAPLLLMNYIHSFDHKFTAPEECIDAIQKLIKAGAKLGKQPFGAYESGEFYNCFYRYNSSNKKKVMRLFVYYDLDYPVGTPEAYDEQCKRHSEAIKFKRISKEALAPTTHTGPVVSLLYFPPVRQAITEYVMHDEDAELEELQKRMEAEEKATEKVEQKSS